MSQQQRRPPGSSYSAFAEVDSLVSKPVLGSDGAASWQEFRKGSKSTSSSTASGGVVTSGAGPILPVKRADRLGTGLSTRADELRHEEDVRRKAGDAPLGSGYTTFKRKLDRDEIAAKKKARLIAERVRPDDARYFIPSKEFDGWKEDYVFTTRDRGTGYYWDGMDSARRQLGLVSSGEVGEGESSAAAEGSKQQGAVEDSTKKKKKKKKRKKKKVGAAEGEPTTVADDTNNPMEQVAAAMRRRQQAMMAGPPGSSRLTSMTAAETAALTGGGLGLASAAGGAAAAAAAVVAAASSAGGCGDDSGGKDSDEVRRLADQGWETAVDPASQKTYYFCRKTGERRWDNPLLPLEKNDDDGNDNAVAPTTSAAAATASSEAAGATSSGGTEQHQQQQKQQQKAVLPEGWQAAEDGTSGKEYYYHAESGRTQWTRPTQ